MASLVLGAVGSYFGPVGAFIGSTIGRVIDAQLFGSGGQTVEGPRLNDLQVTASTYGKPIPLLYGTGPKIGGNVIWSPGIKEHRQEQSVGGKGMGGPSVTNVTYFYTADWGVQFCVGPADAVLRIWFDTKLVYDIRSTTPVYGHDLDASNIRIYLGGEDQEPDPAYEADVGVDNAVPFRGSVTVFFDEVRLENFGNRIPQVTAEISVNASENWPTTTVDTDRSQTTSGARWTADYKQLITGTGGGISVWDTVNKVEISAFTPDTGEILGSAPNSRPFLPVDSAGRIYLARDEAFDSVSVWQYDPLTGQLTGRSALTHLGGSSYNGDFTTAVGVPAMFLAGPSDNQILIVLGAGADLACYRVMNLGEEAETGVGLFLKIAEYNLDTLFPESPSVSYEMNSNYGAAIDGEERPWILAKGTDGNSYLFRLDARTGQPLEKVTLAFEDCARLTYEPSTNSLITHDGVSKFFVRYDLDTEIVDAPLSVNLTSNATANNTQWFQGPVDGKIWLATGNFSRDEIDLVNMEVLRTLNVRTTWSTSNDSRQPVYDRINHALVEAEITADEMHWYFLDRMAGGTITLQEIVEDVSERVGLDSSDDIDASALDDTVRGYLVGNRMAARSAIEPLMPAFFFDGVETDWKATYVKRGAASVATIESDDLGARARLSQDVEDITESRNQELELPERIDFLYADIDRDYQIGTQHEKRVREAVGTRSLVRMEVPIVFTADEAKAIVRRLLYLTWLERSKFDFSLTWEYLRLDPTDVITVNTDLSVTHEIFLHEALFGADGVLSMKGVANDASIYSITGEGAETDEGFTAPTIVVSSPTALYLIDLPMLRDQDDGLGMYIAAGSYGGSWPGATVYQSVDTVSWDNFSSVPSGRDASHGYTTAALASPRAWTTWDRDNEVTIRLHSGSLSSATELAVLNGANGLLIGNEYIQFADATLNADGTYTISTLLRGRRGTEWAIDSHTIGERVVVLSSETLNRVTVGSAALDLTRFYRGVTVGSLISSAQQKSLTYQGRFMMPYAPCSIEGNNAGSPSDWTISWKRRTRVAGDWRGFVDVPLGEADEDYEVDILDGSGDVVRTITTTASANGSVVDADNRQATYTPADQIADFGSEQASLTVAIYQLSETVGRGFGREESLAA